MTGAVDICAVLLHGVVVYALCLGLHVVWWRLTRPGTFRAWVPALAIIFLVIGPGVAWLLAERQPLGLGSADTMGHWLAVLVLHLPASTVYIIGYTLVSAFSPSIEMLKLLARSPGLRRAEIDLPYLRTAVGGDRVRNLLHEGMIQSDGGRVRLGPRARPVTALVLFYRHCIGLPDGAGG